jgi:hypothetical protein
MIPEVVNLNLSPERYPEWDAFVAKHPLGTLHHLSGWVRIASSTLGMESAIVAVEGSDGVLRCGLPVYSVKRLGANHAVNAVFGAHASLLMDEASGDREAMRDVLDGAIRFARGASAKYLHLKSLEGPNGKFDFQHPSYFREDAWVASLLSLSEGSRSILEKASSRLQASVADALGIVGSDESGVVWGADEADLSDFYSVYAEARHREGLPTCGQGFARAVLDEFAADRGGSNVGTDASVVRLRWEDRTAATALVVWRAGVAYPILMAEDGVFSAAGAGDLLVWEILLEAERRGCAWLDFGTSLRGSAELDAREEWGAVAYPVASYVYSESGERVDLEAEVDTNRLGAKIGMSIWKSLPRKTVEWLGPKVSF